MAERSCYTALALKVLIIVQCLAIVLCQVLEPPYFNLGYRKRISATSTCGEGVSEAELFCKLTGADSGNEAPRQFEVIQGQLCDVCDPTVPNQAHSADQAL